MSQSYVTKSEASSPQHWIHHLEAALGSQAQDEVAAEVWHGTRPPLLDSLLAQAFATPLIAAFMWSVAIFRETLSGTPLDPWSLLTRMLAIGLTLRSIVLWSRMIPRLRAWWQAPRYGLALREEGLLLRTPTHDLAIPREDILHIVEHGSWGERSGARWNPVYLIVRPSSGRTHVALPPFFGPTPGSCAERLMRWRGPLDLPETVEHPAPPKLASKIYDDIATGQRPPGVTAIAHGYGWLRRGPYITWLMGLAVLDGLLRLPSSMASQLGIMPPGLVILALVIVPLVWIASTRRSMRARKGLALVLTPSQLLLRTAGGVHRVPWSNLRRTEIRARRTWSLLEGQHLARTLWLHRKDAPEIRYDEAFLGIPAEVVAALCQAYRQGAIAADSEGAVPAACQDSAPNASD